MINKDAVAELTLIAKNVKHKEELVKDFKDTDEKAQELKAIIKKAQDDLEAYLASDLYLFGLKNEIKELNKELVQGSKAVVKGTGFKAPVLRQYVKANSKAIETKIDVGMLFSALNNQVGSTIIN